MTIKILILALAVTLAATGAALANGDLTRPRWVLGGGASESTAGDIALRATLGEPVVGAVTGDGGYVALGQGFWLGGAAPLYDIYLPLVTR